MEEKGEGGKRVLSLAMRGRRILLLLIILILIATPAVAQPVKVWVNAPEYVAEGGTFVVSIDVDNITNFNSGMFDLSFNSSVVVVTDVEEGRLDEETIPVGLWAFMECDTIRVMLELPETTAVSGAGYLAKISFLAVGEEGDESVLNLSDGELVKYVFEDDRATPEAISAEWIDTEVRIVKGELEPTSTPPADRVHNLNTSENFSFIQAAIDDPDTKNGHVIEVEDGIYYENVKVTKCLTIRSENGSANCIVQAAKANDNVFEVTMNYACICGFTVKGATAWSKAGIYLNASHCSVSNNNCSNDYCGIRLENSNNNTISDNNCFLNNEDGVYLSCSGNNTLSDNNCSLNNWAGIHLQNSSDNYINENNLSNNGESIYIQGSINNIMSDNRCSSNNNWGGIYLINSRSNIMFNNNCSSNSNYGIHLSESSDNNVISDNTCSSNGNGIALSDSNNNNIFANNCSLNDIGIHLWFLSTDNIISNNTCSSNNIGFRLYEAGSNTISNNICSNNGEGILILGSHNNIISNNNCSSNTDYGIELYLSSNNRIYLNNFINTKNIYSWGGNQHLELHFKNNIHLPREIIHKLPRQLLERL